MKGFPDLPPLWLLAFMAAAWALARYAPDPQMPLGLIKGGGIASAAVGLALIFWSAFWFWRKRTTIEPHHTPGALIVEGPYRLSRNPIYLGMVMILWGYICWLAFLPSLLLAPLYILILSRRFAIPEERALVEAFGEEGRAYLAATRRWI
ncbi:isoprenylcysteine carboxylmethyltransferase family protein [Rhodobacteraceae bacterium N5(2021)]|uniref:Isoprenylcysteine carboxylmethyltransferase family protein n=1 Tax=Gymnodinialimonas phycosphaerae TaxID=2841589 RepID=A0A975TWZ3_9RHOB|nr:isoprenylcysteine carboxylmethyltransferase family protein [Gymnodinialimonas phycosphaerae]MBY4892487.1 isoprenylcysteine carboxylmethyltransferase family protein [Gymnodinialimonas phycosphaerae]